MAIYSVYLPPEHSGADPVEKFRLLRDAKAPLALIFPPFWLAWHRLWVELTFYAAVALAISLFAAWNPLPPVLYLSAIPGLFLLLEGNELVRRKLERTGWRFSGVIDAQNHEEAEIKFITTNEDLLKGSNVVLKNKQRLTFSTQTNPSAPAGLFPE